MSIIPTSLIGSDDDWIEPLRNYLFPRLHSYASKFGELIGVPLYATANVGWNQYVGYFEENEDDIEVELQEVGMVRNPVAALKTLPDGRESEGSWVLLHENAPDVVDPGMQLHLTLFKFDSDKAGREVYAHYEDDWRDSPIDHTEAENFSPKMGVKLARSYLDENSFLLRQE
jgi:hypothetical protein